MGNICGSSRCIKHGFFRSIWHSPWWSRSPDMFQYEKRKARNHHRHAKNHKVTKAVQNTPPKVVSIAQEDHKPAQPIQPAVKEHGKQSGKVVIVKQQSKPTPKNVQNNVKYSQHKRRKSSAGLLVDNVLKTRSGNLKDHYTIGLKLGQGQFGTTSICISKKTGKQYACKSIAKRKLVTDDDVEDVRREVEIMHHLSGHPNVVSIEGAYEDAYEVHLVMELCGGGELFERISQKGHYSERKAADLIRTIASVIEAYGLKRFGADLDESDTYDLMQSADIDNSGTIDYDEFVAATLHFNKVDREDRLFAAFSYFDKDGSGYITRHELQQACKEFGVDGVHLEEIIKEVDQNNDGRIDYSEFVAMMHKGTATLARNRTKNNFIIGFKEPLRAL
ncbi:hypothetical protein M8C21_011928 [Ambrosia artemisiifolia]|uniref:non-specific serine/threonine protein kinase n=1 Tax=Ambrosia artemisiifolia TaxID=4212 RepID=A0AAD5GAX8_AMBAR|nr:hypothetical protein M8C21_011928 [Ambrosia artemisiifolia]